MAQDGPSIHTGFWIDWSKENSVLGATITYDTKWGSQLVSGATVLVQLMGAAVWSLTAFWLHQQAVSGKLYDEFGAQKQVILRNPGGAPSTILLLWNLAKTWHGHARNARWRALTLVSVPCTIFAGFAVASIFSRPAQVRAVGYVNQTDSSLSAQVAFMQLLTNTSLVADSYARDCYANAHDNLVSCSSFAKPRLTYRSLHNVPCPLGPGGCAINDNAAVSFLAYFDSHADLGINAKRTNRVQLGYNATCAPVSQSMLNSLTVLDNSTGLRDDTQVYPTLHLNIGQVRGHESSFPYNYSTAQRYYSSGTSRYSVTSFRSWFPHVAFNPLNYLNSFSAGPPFSLLEKDLSLFVIAQNKIGYSQPSEDPVFRTYNTTGSNGYYYTDHDVSVIACAEEYQICNTLDNCTTWDPIVPLFLGPIGNLHFTDDQNATWTRLAATVPFANMYFAAHISSLLRASDFVTGGSVSVGLPDDQWTHEVEAWFQSTLAQMQYLQRIFPQRPESMVTSHNLTVIAPDTAVGLAQCGQQLIQTPPGYASYNLFALVLIFVVAVLTILFTFWLSAYGHNLPNRRPGQKSHQELLAFQGDGMLQLHRMAVEAAGYGGWKSGSGHKKEVPYVDQAQARLPPPTIVDRRGTATTLGSDADTEVDVDSNSIEDGLLNYFKRQSLMNQENHTSKPPRARDRFSWIQLKSVSER